MEKNKKQKQQFTIIKDDSTDGHGGYGMGSISLENMSSVIVDPNENKAYVDMDAMHARSNIERRVRYYSDRNEVPDGLLYWIVWVTVERGENGPYYAGVAASELRVDRPNKRAYKSMPEHVTHMEKSLKGKVVVEHMDEKSKKLLEHFLQDFNEDMWENTSDELKDQLSN
ncbi:YwhD family protein [Pseudogracilibacillus auburnensis]|uniref:YwhD-like protein n=1 Tax=Pseudogracilibacillus auburnensis TaxID=1494959 RepID=A0A2V3VZC7_9BACI|nr:YwhD family protein [Pseudogracilibacillus auburnensis]MBO1002089.1 YwhD family protein [Pseudogracilibacillus auburnensis]PXW87413.1 YwhD-like protein [Pseudogracilibacillus auburnensis]